MANTHTILSGTPLATPGVAKSRVRLELSERRLLLATGDALVIITGLVTGLAVWSGRTELSFGIELIRSQLIWIGIVFNAWLLWLNVVDLYDLRVAVARWSAIARIWAGSLVIGLAYLIYFFVRAVPLSSLEPTSYDPPLRFAPVISIVLTAALLSLWRLTYAFVWGAPHMRRRVLILGAGSAGTTLAHALQSHAHIGAVGYVDDDPGKIGEQIQGIPVFGGHDCLLALVEKNHIDEIALAISANPSGSLLQSIMDCHERGISITPMPLLYEQVTGRIAVEHIGSQWYVALPIGNGRPSTLVRITKRLMDLVIGMLICGVFAVLLPFIALAIVIDNKGRVFYRQERVGLHGKPFTVVKFRSMYENAEKDGRARWAVKGDHRITRVGKFLRKTRLDELPQVLNVLRGEMSIVGPRPERQQFVDELQKQIPFYRTRHAAKPGLTGWAQVSYGYGATVEDALTKLQYDLYYLKHQSPIFDLSILMRTVAVVLKMKGQ